MILVPNRMLSLALSVLSLMFLASCASAFAKETSLTVKVNQTPQVIRAKEVCSSIANKRLGAKCVACVTRAKPHVFKPFKPAGKRCQEPPKKAAPAIPTVMGDQRTCEAHISDARLKAKCVACVTRNKPHLFTPSAAPGKRCNAPAPKPSPPAVLRGAGQCKSQISDRRMSAKCVACVTRKSPHTFQPSAPAGQRCQEVRIETRPAPRPAAVPQAPRTLKNAAQCKAQISDRRMSAKCVACVTRKKAHLFDPNNPAGPRCQPHVVVPPPKVVPPAAPKTLRNASQCKSQISDRRMSAKCVACVTRKSPHVFDPNASAGQRCQDMPVRPRPMPVAFTNPADCRSKLGNARDAAKCVACVTRKNAHRFKPQAPAGKRCEPTVAPPPPGLKSAADCKSRVKNRRDKSKCVACVTRKKAHSFFPARAAGKRCQPR